MAATPDELTSPNQLYELGRALQSQGKSRQAIACLEKVILLLPDYAAAHCSLADTLYDLRELERAVSERPEYLPLATQLHLLASR